MGGFLSGTLFFIVDKGKVRPTNEDFADARTNAFGQIILIVADGMGGKNKGDYAARYVGEKLAKAFQDLEKPLLKPHQATRWLYKTINRYNRDLYSKAHANEAYKSMGTTLSVALLFSDQLVTAQVGDSRIYWINKEGILEQLTKDQTYVEHLVASKKIDRYEAMTHPERHKLTNAVGVRYNISIDFINYEYNGETILVCSDGLYNNVPKYDLQSILKGKDTPERKCYQLIAFGNSNGGSDNMAAVVWERN